MGDCGDACENANRETNAEMLALKDVAGCEAGWTLPEGGVALLAAGDGNEAAATGTGEGSAAAGTGHPVKVVRRGIANSLTGIERRVGVETGSPSDLHETAAVGSSSVVFIGAASAEARSEQVEAP